MMFKTIFFGSSDLSPRQEKVRMFGMYAFCGIFTVIANALAFVLFDKLVTATFPVTVIRWEFDLVLLLNQFVSWIAAVFTAFVSNRIFVFRSHGSFILEFLGFAAARFFSFVLVETFLFSWMIIICEHAVSVPTDTPLLTIFSFELTMLYVVKFLNCVILVIVNYLASRYIVFRKAMARGQDGRTRHT